MATPTAQRTLLQIVLDALPSVSLVVLVLVGSAPIGARFWPEIGPMLVVVAVFFWSSDGNNALPFWVVFAVGLLMDSLAGVPLGLYTLTLLIVAGAASTQKKTFAGKPFYLPWFGMAVISLMALTINYGVNMVYYLCLFDPTPIMGQWIAGVVIYPLMALILGLLRLRINTEIKRQT